MFCLSVCVFLTKITQERIEIYHRALKPDGLLRVLFMKPQRIILDELSYFMSFVILDVKKDADFKNGTCKMISERLGVVLVGFDLIGCFWKDFNYFCLSRVGYHFRG